MKIKYQLRKNLNFILFAISLTILLSQLIHGICTINLNLKEEKIIGKSNAYLFWNLTQPSEENINKIENFSNILLIEKEQFEENNEYKSKISELIKLFKEKIKKSH